MNRSLWEDRVQSGSTSPEVVAAIQGGHLLLERFGDWPKFEDFEIISLELDRGNLMKIFETNLWSDKIMPSLTVIFHGFDIHHSADDLNRKPTLLKMRFHGPFERFALDGFNHQNPICGLEIVFEYSDHLKRNLFAVDWGGTALHHDTSFTCERVEVVAVEDLQV
jgi:hypothetical protein